MEHLTIYDEIRKISHRSITLVNKIDNTHKKIANFSNRIYYLNKCKEYNYFPNHVNHLFKNLDTLAIMNSKLTHKIDMHVNKFKSDIINIEIKNAYQMINQFKQNLNKDYEILKHELPIPLFHQAIAIINQKNRYYYINAKNKINKKLDKSIQINEEINVEDDYLINLSDIEIPEEIKLILRLGPKFSLNLNKNKEKDIINLISEIECQLKYSNKPSKEKKIIRNKLNNIIQNYLYKIKNKKNIKNDYLIKAAMKTFEFKKINKRKIIFLQSDKSNISIVMNKSEYDEKMNNILSDENTYKVVKKDPTSKVEKCINKFAVEAHKSDNIGKDELKKIKISPFHSSLGSCYGLVKVHKPERPLRLIVSNLNGPQNNLERYIANILKNIISSEVRVKNSYMVVDIIQEITIQHDETLISFDVRNLFPSIPIDLVYRIMKERWSEIEKYTYLTEKQFIEAIGLCLDNCFFRHDNNIYKQLKGVPIGGCLSPIIADLVMDKIYVDVIKPMKLKLYIQYVDDSLAIVKKNSVDLCIEALNSFNDNLDFTYEKELNNNISFLDIKIVRVEERLRTDLYVKDSKSNRMLNFKSVQPLQHKISLIYGEIGRLDRICDESYRDIRLIELQKKCESNGYSKQFFNKVLTKYRKNKLVTEVIKKEDKIIKGSIPYIHDLSAKILRILNNNDIKLVHSVGRPLMNIFNNKTHLEKLDKMGVVYEIVCDSCKKDKKTHKYIGETSRHLRQRIKEHISSINGNKLVSALSIHAIDNEHTFDFEGVKILDYEKNWTKRKIKESLYILKDIDNSVNFKMDSESISECYSLIVSLL